MTNWDVALWPTAFFRLCSWCSLILTYILINYSQWEIFVISEGVKEGKSMKPYDEPRVITSRVSDAIRVSQRLTNKCSSVNRNLSGYFILSK